MTVRGDGNRPLTVVAGCLDYGMTGCKKERVIKVNRMKRECFSGSKWLSKYTVSIIVASLFSGTVKDFRQTVRNLNYWLKSIWLLSFVSKKQI